MEKIWVPVLDEKNPNGYRLEEHPILFPHRIISFLFDHVGIEFSAGELDAYWGSTLDSRSRIPLGLYGDGAQLVTKIRIEKIFCLWMNLPIFRPKSVRYSRFLLWSCDAYILLQNKTVNQVLRWVVWSLNSLYEGVHPNSRPGGRPLSQAENRRAGTPITEMGYKFQVTEIRGDWEFHKLIWKFKCSWNSTQVCFKCGALAKNLGDPGMLYWNLDENSSWSQNEFTTHDFINQRLHSTNVCNSLMSSKGYKYNIILCFFSTPSAMIKFLLLSFTMGLDVRICFHANPGPLVNLRAFSIDIVKWCSMHVLNLGILFRINGGCLTLGQQVPTPHVVPSCSFRIHYRPQRLEMRFPDDTLGDILIERSTPKNQEIPFQGALICDSPGRCCVISPLLMCHGQNSIYD